MKKKKMRLKQKSPKSELSRKILATLNKKKRKIPLRSKPKILMKRKMKIPTKVKEES